MMRVDPREVERAPVARAVAAVPVAFPPVTDAEVEAKFGHALRRVPSGQRAAVRDRLRRGMALDRLA